MKDGDVKIYFLSSVSSNGYETDDRIFILYFTVVGWRSRCTVIKYPLVSVHNKIITARDGAPYGVSYGSHGVPSLARIDTVPRLYVYVYPCVLTTMYIILE